MSHPDPTRDYHDDKKDAVDYARASHSKSKALHKKAFDAHGSVMGSLVRHMNAHARKMHKKAKGEA